MIDLHTTCPLEKPFALSLFSGAGGLDLGFVWNGWSICLACEILPHAVRTYSLNFHADVLSPNDLRKTFGERAVVLGDVSELDFSLIPAEPTAVIAGPPCQDFSILRSLSGDRKGIETERGKLYMHFVRAIALLKPAVFVFENVPGLVSANRGLAYRRILSDLQNVRLVWLEIRSRVGDGADETPNYRVIFSSVISAVSAGAPQARRRLIIIGVREDLIGGLEREASRVCAEVLLERGRLLEKYPLTPLEAFEGKPLPDLDGKYREVMHEYQDLLSDFRPRGVVEDYLRENRIEPSSPQEIDLAFERHEKILKHLGWYAKRVSELNLADGSCRMANERPEVLRRMRQVPPGENSMRLRDTPWEVKTWGGSQIYRRLHPLKPAYTVIAYGGGGTRGYHYERGRSQLTNRERARLQTFPDSFLFWGSPSQQRAQIGEAVPPLLAERIAEACRAILQLR